MELYTGVDPASSLSTRADYFVIATLAIDSNNNLYVGGASILQATTIQGQTIANSDVSLNGHLSVSGDTSMNHLAVESISLGGSIIPDQDNVYSLGSENFRFKEMHVTTTVINSETLYFNYRSSH